MFSQSVFPLNYSPSNSFFFIKIIFFLSSPTGTGGRNYLYRKIVIERPVLTKRKIFHKIFSISVNELCQVLITKAGNIFCASKVNQNLYREVGVQACSKQKLGKPSKADKKYFCNQNPGRVFTDIRWNPRVSYSEEKYWCWRRDKHLKNLRLAGCDINSLSLCRPVSDLTSRLCLASLTSLFVVLRKIYIFHFPAKVFTKVHKLPFFAKILIEKPQ